MHNGKYDIVIIEDNKIHAEFIASILDETKFRIKIFFEGKIAIDYLIEPEYFPDVIITDNYLQDIEGIEIIDYFTKLSCDYAFIILTGSNSISLAVKAMKVGAMNYIAKSANLKDELQLVVENTISYNTERINKKLLERKLKESEERFKKYYKSTPTPTYTWQYKDNDFILLDFNDAALKITNNKISNFLGAKASFLFADDAVVQAKMKQCYQNQELIQDEHFYTFRTTKITLLLKTTYVSIPDDLVMVHTEDITEERIAQNKLKELNTTKDKLFSIIGHDLRGPIGGFKSLVEYMLTSYDLKNTEHLTETLKLIQESASSTYYLLENLLFWAKSQRNAITFNLEEINLFEICSENIILLKENAKLKSITIHNLIPENFPIYADYNMLSTIIRNLINNAIKFTGNDKNIYIEVIQKVTEFEISVKDEGIGINPENIEKLFNTTENFTTYGTEGEKGSGLGLLLCKEFTEKHGGKIWAESEVGRGSTFLFTIPLKKRETTNQNL